jgi:hypothetical protein
VEESKDEDEVRVVTASLPPPMTSVCLPFRPALKPREKTPIFYLGDSIARSINMLKRKRLAPWST